MKIVAIAVIGCMAMGAQAASILFENFEQGNGISTGLLDGQNGWSVDAGYAGVQTSVVQDGAQALEIAGGSVSKQLSPDGTALWLHFQARIAAVPQLDPEIDLVGAQAVFYVNTNQNLVVLSNGVPAELSIQMPLDTWVRFDIHCDFSSKVWNLAMNGSNVAAGLPLLSTNLSDRVEFSNSSATGSFLDSIDIADTEQANEVPDSDADGVPDWWEQKYFGDPTAANADAPSGNGDLTYRETYIAVLDPFVSDPPFSAMKNGELFWTAKPSRLHNVEWAPSLASNFVVIASDIPWPVESYLDTTHTNDPAGFYRVNIHL